MENNTQFMLNKASFLLGIAWSALTASRATIASHDIQVPPEEENAYKTLTDGIEQLFYTELKERP